MTKSHTDPSINWYRIKLPPGMLKKLSSKSDFKGFLQSGGLLALLAVTGTLAWWSIGRYHPVLSVLIFFLYGTFHSFIINGFHELVHYTVFKTKWLNTFFLYIYSFLGMHNAAHFIASHNAHHKFTLHPPSDLEVVLPKHINFRALLISGIVIMPKGMFGRYMHLLNISLGRINEKTTDEWTRRLFPEGDREKRREYINFARFILGGHLAIAAVAIASGLWPLLLLVTLAPFYGQLLRNLCNETQHAGLTDNVPDFRLCCRTMYLNPLFQFLYWHMNYHTEHHMYASVPCYNLGKLHKAIKHEMPECPNGLYATWKQILAIQKRQQSEPGYQYMAPLPKTAAQA